MIRVFKPFFVAAAMLTTASLSFAPVAMAQDVSPTLLIETGPNENPQYRRVVFVKYLSGNRVQANYRADNRTEFMRVNPDTPQELVDKCANGQATSLGEIQAYSRDEAQRMSRRQAPQIRSFCIKNVYDWERRNKDAYLDPIFESMPVSIQGL